MKIENNKIVEATEDELFDNWLKSGLDIIPFDIYLWKCEKNGTKIIDNKGVR